MCSMLWCAAVVLAAFSLMPIVNANIEFTNIKCEVVDKTYIHFEYCFLKAVNRTYKYISTRVRFHSDDLIHNISVGLALMQRANGYKPFLYNFTLDGCQYLRTRSNPVARYFHQLFEKFSNINHTCPFKDYIAVDKMSVSHIDYMMSTVLPIPHGEYMVHSTWYSYNIKRSIVKIYWKVF